MKRAIIEFKMNELKAKAYQLAGRIAGHSISQVKHLKKWLHQGLDFRRKNSWVEAIAELRPQDLLQPITIQPQPGSEDSVLFCRLYLGVEPVRTTYNEESNFREISKQALAVVRALEIPVG